MRLLLLVSVCLALPACALLPGGKPGPFANDADGDGFPEGEDCDDADASVHPEAEERCDPADRDEDCDGLADDADPDVTGGITVYRDADGDGHGADGSDTPACELGPGYAATAGDCDDADPAVNPEAEELCDAENTDEDCNGLADDEDPGVRPEDEVQVFADTDGDGYGDPEATSFHCDPPANTVADDTDCDDTRSDVYPGAPEYCDGHDDDCDGETDEASALDAAEWYADDDGDGHGDPDSTRLACEQPEGWVAAPDDCDDAAPDTHPGAPETCGGADEDCDGAVDEADASDASSWYADADRDGYGDERDVRVQCEAPEGYVASATDCDDGDGAVNPAASEVCDTTDTDEDCDGLTEDADGSVAAASMSTWYLDGDRDGYGSASSPISRCDAPAGYVADNEDCDDARSGVNPAASEVCDTVGRDEDCDGVDDDEDSSTAEATKARWYRDADLDGYGLATSSVTACDEPSGYVDDATDCDDGDSRRNPGNTEACDDDDRDEDCDGLADDADSSVRPSSQTSWYLDDDADGFGVTESRVAACEAPSGHTADPGDCDDGDEGVNPAAYDSCFDAEDTDCDGQTSCARSDTDAGLMVYGASPTDSLGRAHSSAGDLNGDGIDDLLIGAPSYDGTDDGLNGGGAAWIVYGGGGGVLDAASADVRLTGRWTSGGTGSAVAGVGDWDGDGTPDVLIGSPGAWGAGGTAEDAGAVYLVGGPPNSGDVTTVADATIEGETSFDAAGSSVDALGDVDGDGRADVAVGAYGRGNYDGAVYVLTAAPTGTWILGSATGMRTGESSFDYAGATVASAGDVDADGYADLLVGASGDDDGGSGAGAAYLLYGPVEGTASLSTADVKLRGISASTGLGNGVAGGGDFDDDGYDDIAVTADSRSTYIFAGPLSGAVTTGSADATVTPSGALSTAPGGVAMDCDMDGDGRDDLLIGNELVSTVDYRGAAFLFVAPLAGSYTSEDAQLSIDGTTDRARFGGAVAYVGAQDGSTTGCSFLVGATRDETGGSYAASIYAGAVWVFSPGAF